MDIIKRDGTKVPFDGEKIKKAIRKAFKSVNKVIQEDELETMVNSIIDTIEKKFPESHIVTVEEVQDLVELTLIDNRYYTVVRSEVQGKKWQINVFKKIFSIVFTNILKS